MERKIKLAAPQIAFYVTTPTSACGRFNKSATNLVKGWPGMLVRITQTKVIFTPDVTKDGHRLKLRLKRNDSESYVYCHLFSDIGLTGKAYRLHYNDDSSLYINRYTPLKSE